MWYGHEGMHGGGAWIPTIIGLVVLAGLVALVVWIVLRMTRHEAQAAPMSALTMSGPTMSGAGRPDAALEALRLRYARGEIDRDTYARIAADLGGAVPPAPPEG